jgi:hypothetical protein
VEAFLQLDQPPDCSLERGIQELGRRGNVPGSNQIAVYACWLRAHAQPRKPLLPNLICPAGEHSYTNAIERRILLRSVAVSSVIHSSFSAPIPCIFAN